MFPAAQREEILHAVSEYYLEKRSHLDFTASDATQQSAKDRRGCKTLTVYCSGTRVKRKCPGPVRGQYTPSMHEKTQKDPVTCALPIPCRQGPPCQATFDTPVLLSPACAQHTAGSKPTNYPWLRLSASTGASLVLARIRSGLIVYSLGGGEPLHNNLVRG